MHTIEIINTRYRHNKNINEYYTKISESMSITSISKTAQSWMNNVREPSKHMPIISELSDEQYMLEYAYGYRSHDTRQNIIFHNGKLVYMTATVIIEMDAQSGFQTIHGGGENLIDNCSSIRHTDDILCIGATTDKKLMASSQIGKKPCIIFWEIGESLKAKSIINLPNQCTGVSTLSFSADGKYLACASVCNRHTFFIIDVEKLKIEDTFDGHTDKIFEIAWSKKPGDYTLIGVGIFCVKFFTPFGQVRKYQYGLFKANKICHFICCTYDENGVAYTAGTNGQIYVWDGAICTRAIAVHTGTIHCLFYHNNQIYSGATDNKLCITKVNDMTVTSTIELSSCPRAIDIDDNELAIGLRNGSILHIDKTSKKLEIHTSHSEGELCGLAIDGNILISAGEDNKILTWDYKAHKIIKQVLIDEIKPDVESYPPQNCTRALGINSKNHHLAVGTNFGTIQIRESASLIGNILLKLKCGKKPISVISYSPDGQQLAVGSYDSLIYLYQVGVKYLIKHVLAGHKEIINGIDWSTDGKYLRSNSDSNEIYYWDAIQGKREDKIEKMITIEWDTTTCKLSWECTGLYPQGTESSFINSVNTDLKKHLLICGNDWGSIFIAKNPAKDPSKARLYYGHSESVKKVIFSSDYDYFFSVGGCDHTLFQWKRLKI